MTKQAVAALDPSWGLTPIEARDGSDVAALDPSSGLTPFEARNGPDTSETARTSR
jgi:hypothetical protein